MARPKLGARIDNFDHLAEISAMIGSGGDPALELRERVSDLQFTESTPAIPDPTAAR
jgi:hypothetical protein